MLTLDEYKNGHLTAAELRRLLGFRTATNSMDSYWPNQLFAPEAPALVQNWIANPPAWLEVRPASELPDSPALDAGTYCSSTIVMALLSPSKIARKF
jgi:hypothetical protein